jgi:transposase
MPRYIGLDLHKRTLEVCFVDEVGSIIKRMEIQVSREAITAFARSQLQPDDRIAVEATGNAWPVVRLLRPYVAEIAVGNGMKTRLIAQARIKTDKVDALVLAQLLRTNFLPTVWQPDPETLRLRSLSHRRAALVQDRTGVKNRIHGILYSRMIKYPDERLFSKPGLAWLKQVELDADARTSIDADLRLVDQLTREIDAIEQVLVEAVAPDPRVKLLLTLPGVDVVCALALLAALGDLSRFPDGDHAASYLGLVPSTKQSAGHTYHGPITRAGDANARWVLIQAAQHLAKHPGPLGVFFRKIAKRKNWNVAVVATARKLVVIAYLMLKNGEPYRYAQPFRTQSKLRTFALRTGGDSYKKGPKLGEPRKALIPGKRSRLFPSLDALYEREGLPPRQSLRPGEQRVVDGMEIDEFLSMLDHERIVVKGPSEAKRYAALEPPEAYPENQDRVRDGLDRDDAS